MSRTLPPVRSPLTLGAIRRGWQSATSTQAAVAAERALRDGLRSLGISHQLRFTDSGTTALALAIRLAARKAGGPVALPAYGCFDLATAVDAAQVEFVLYDLDPETLAPEITSLRRALDAGAQSVVVVHLYGLPVDIPALRSALPSSVLWVDDAAQGIGASMHGQPLGTLGQLGVLSFGRGKGLTGGGGGALLVDPGSPLAGEVDELPLAPSGAGALPSLIKTQAQWILARPSLYAIPRALPFLGLGETVYGPPHPAAEIARFALGALAVGVETVGAEREARVRHARAYGEALADLELLLPKLPADGGPGWLRFPVIIPERAVPAAHAEASARLGIMPGYPRALSDLDGFGGRRRNLTESFPRASLLAQRLITLPTHGGLTASDVAAVVGRVRELLAH